MPNSETTLADRVRLLIARERGNTTLAAKKAGMPLATLDRIVRGVVTSPRRSALESLARSYGVSIGWLLTGEDATMPARPSIGAASVEEAMRLWASVVFQLQLPWDLEAAMLDLPLAFEDFCGLLGLEEGDEDTREFLERQRTEQLLGFREALRLAIQRYGAPAVRDGLVTRTDQIRLRLSHFAVSQEQAGVLTTARVEKSPRFAPFVPIFAKGGEFSVDWRSVADHGLMPLRPGALEERSLHLASGPIDAVQASKRVRTGVGEPASERKPAARKARRGAPKTKRRRSAG